MNAVEPRKKGNLSRHARKRQPRPEFSTTFVAVGMGIGMVGGLVVEVALNRLEKLIMLAGMLAGMAVAAAVAGVRYWWEKRAWRRSQKP